MQKRKAALPKWISLFSHSLFIKEIKLDDGSFQLLYEFLALVYICGRSGCSLGFIMKQETDLQFSLPMVKNTSQEDLVVKVGFCFENNKFCYIYSVIVSFK